MPGVSNALLARSLGTATLSRVWTGKPYKRYGAVNANGTATSMAAELHGPQVYGSKPTVKPVWWPNAPPATKAWFEKYMVQGHLLNDNVGGPGNTLQNLTPLTKTGNSFHLHSAETHLKEQLKAGAHVEYNVVVEHGRGVSGKGLGIGDAAVEADVDANYANRIPEFMTAEVDYYTPTGVWKYGEGWVVQNEKV